LCLMSAHKTVRARSDGASERGSVCACACVSVRACMCACASTYANSRTHMNNPSHTQSSWVNLVLDCNRKARLLDCNSRPAEGRSAPQRIHRRPAACLFEFEMPSRSPVGLPCRPGALFCEGSWRVCEDSCRAGADVEWYRVPSWGCGSGVLVCLN